MFKKLYLKLLPLSDFKSQLCRMFKALVTKKDDTGFKRQVCDRSLSDLPGHDTLVRVHYSSLNYKDALSASGNKGVTKRYPHTPGIDAAGVVEETSSPAFSPGDKVIATSYDLGQNTPGGFGQYIRVPSEWIVPLPEGLTLKQSMILGTAGFTAAYGLYKLRYNGITPRSGKMLVTGATGGVGSLAIAISGKLGYEVTAVTGKKDQKVFLEKLGATEIVNRESVTEVPESPLLTRRWNGVIETVGGSMLDAVIRQTDQDGVVACCGNILDAEVNTSIYPFILRGVNLMGIDSGNCKMEKRRMIWNLLAGDWKPNQMETISREVTLYELDEEIQKILHGRQTGRIIVNLKTND